MLIHPHSPDLKRATSSDAHDLASRISVGEVQAAAVKLSVPARPDASLLAIIAESCSSKAAQQGGWRIETTTAAPSLWIMVRNERAANRAQGWKLHISAGAASAETVLGRALDVLLAENADFKVVASIPKLIELNNGDGGFSQIGKFITVYPNDDKQAVRLAVALDQATRGLRGPAIPSDRPLCPGSLIYYRYGSFTSRQVQTAAGAILPAITTPAGDLVPDPRASFYRVPSWVDDPFSAAEVASTLQPPNPLINGRYLVIAMLYRSAGGAVARAIDIAVLRRCVIKRAGRDAQMLRTGQDARDVLRHEADVLARLSPDAGVPDVFDLFEQDGDLFLVMEDIAGETLEQYIGSLAEQGRCISSLQIIAWGRALAAALATIHARGFVYCDLKLSNVIVTPEKRLRLIDFDLAYETAAQALPYGHSTRGYASPQQQAGEAPTRADDVYSLGALLYALATGVEPALAPRPFALLDRPLSLLNPRIEPGLEPVVARCLSPDPAQRFPSMAALDDALAAMSTTSVVMPALFGSEGDSAAGANPRRHYRVLASRLGDSLCGAAQRALGRQAGLWISNDHADNAHWSRDLYDGSAGALLVLAELAMAFDDPRYRAMVIAGADRLLTAPQLSGRPLSGLYIGEAGTGAALLRAGQALGDVQLIGAAGELGRRVATQPYASPDLLLGTAGRLRYHLLLWDTTVEPEHLQHAVAAGEALLATAEDVEAGGVRWRVPVGYASLSDHVYCGFAHGAAGIADALLDLFEATGDERFLAAAQGAGRWLARLAVPALEDESGLTWPQHEGGALTGACWYDGATGIGQFFLHAALLGAIPEAADLAARAARTAARGARWAGPTQSHGLAGNIEFLLDMFQATGDHTYLSEAHGLAHLLEAWMEERDGGLICLSVWPDTLPPGCVVGYGGIALCLLRLGDPEHMPRLLSRHGFCHRPVPTEMESGAARVPSPKA